MRHLHNNVFNPFENGRRWHKGETTLTYPSAPAQPSTAEAIDAWVKSMPAVFAEQQRQAPLEAQQQMDLASQYALPMAETYKTAQETLYPGTSAIQETAANQAVQGMTATSMPDWMRKQYQSDYNAQLGSNVASPIGADYVSKGMQKQLFEQQKYYRDLGLSLAGRQPLSQPTTPATTNYASTFTPASVMDYAQRGYNTLAGASRPFASQSQPLSLGFLGQWG